MGFIETIQSIGDEVRSLFGGKYKLELDEKNNTLYISKKYLWKGGDSPLSTTDFLGLNRKYNQRLLRALEKYFEKHPEKQSEIYINVKNPHAYSAGENLFSRRNYSGSYLTADEKIGELKGKIKDVSWALPLALFGAFWAYAARETGRTPPEMETFKEIVRDTGACLSSIGAFKTIESLVSEVKLKNFERYRKLRNLLKDVNIKFCY
ncbi:MAG: hypothetical protein QW051_04280 [Candidatus Aenigmatarchaeota archaeon]